MSQVKKYETGSGNSGIQPSKLKVKVNGKDYDIDEQSLQDAVNPAFDQLKEKGLVNEHNREAFMNSYKQYVQQAKQGTYNINSSDDKYLNGSYEGPANATLGRDKDGHDALKTKVGNIISPHHLNEDQMMNLVNTSLGDHIIDKYGADQADIKKKADAEAAKTKLASQNKINEYVGGYDSFRNPASALYGKDADGEGGIAWAQNRFKSMKKGQDNMLFNTLAKQGNYLFSSDLDSQEAQDAFKAKYGQNVSDLRNIYTNSGYANGKFGKDFNKDKYTGVLDSLDQLRAYDEFFKSGSATTAQTTTGGTGGSASTSAINNIKKDGAEFTGKDGTIFKDKDGKIAFTGLRNGALFNNGKIFSGIYNPDYTDDLNYEHSDANKTIAGSYWQGKRVGLEDLENNIKHSGSQSLIDSFRSTMDGQSKYRNDLFSGMTDLASNTNENTSDLYAFKKELGTDNQVNRATNLTHKFTDIARRGENLYVYKGKGKDQFGNDGVVRYRHISKTGTIFDGLLKQDHLTGKYLLDDLRGHTMQLGHADENAKPVDSVNAFIRNADIRNSVSPITHDYGIDTSPAYKEGGILKAQTGGLLKGVGTQKTDFKSADINGQVFGQNTLSTADKTQLYGLVAELGGVAAGFIPGGSIASAGLGVAGTAANFSADYMKHGFKWGDVGSAVGGLALDAASAIPGFGEAAKIGKTANMIRKSAKLLTTGFAALGAVKATASLTKLMGDQKMDVDDWTNIMQGIHSVVAGKRLTDEHFATQKVTTNTIKVNGTEKEISPEIVASIKAASPGDKVKIAAQHLGVPEDQIDTKELTKLTPGIINKAVAASTFGMFGKKDSFQVPELNASGERVLRDYNTSGLYRKLAIRNTVAQNPSMKGAEDFTIGNGKNATEGKSLNWLANSYKMKYNPQAGNPSTDDIDVTNKSGFNVSSMNSNVADKPKTKLEENAGPTQGFGGKSLPILEPIRNYVKFKKGGVLKAADGAELPSPFSNLLGNKLLNTAVNQVNSLGDNTKPVDFSTLIGNKNLMSAVSRINNQNWTSPTIGSTSDRAPDSINRIKLPNLNGINGTSLSELGRALFTRRINSQIDTRVERPMVAAPTEISVPVQGNLLAKNAYDKQANNVIQSSNGAQTADAAVNRAINLDANTKAAGLRTQGDMANIQALDQSKQQASQSAAKYAEGRTNAANQNVQTLARATQAERSADAEKTARMNQPLIDFWKNEDYKSAVQDQQNKALDMQIALQGKSEEFQNVTRPINNDQNTIENRLDQLNTKSNNVGLSATEKQEFATLSTRNSDNANKLGILQGKLSNINLQTRKNVNYITPKQYYNIQSNKAGGKVLPIINKADVENVKQANATSSASAKQNIQIIKSSEANQVKEGVSAMKQIQDLIKLALR